MARVIGLALMLVAMLLIIAYAEMNATDEDFSKAHTRSRAEEDAEQRTTMVVANGVIITAVLIGFPLSVAALGQTRWGRRVRRRLIQDGSLSRRKILPPVPQATSSAHGATSSRGPIGLIAAAYRNDPVGTLGWIGLVTAIGVLPVAIWLSSLRF